jgi:hypothetical protein
MLAPVPLYPERSPQFYERKMGPDAPGQRGPQRFQEGIESDTDVPVDFGVGASAGAPDPARPNHNRNVYEKWPEETMRQRAHVGSASWIDAPSVLGEFSQGAFSGYGDVHFEAVQNSGMRTQRRNGTTVSD